MKSIKRKIGEVARLLQKRFHEKSWNKKELSTVAASLLIGLFLVVLTHSIVFSSNDYESSSPYGHDLSLLITAYAEQTPGEGWVRNAADGGVELGTLLEVQPTADGDMTVFHPGSSVPEELLTGGDASFEDFSSRNSDEPSIDNLQITSHRVQSGETLASIASRYGRRVGTLLSFNQLSNPNLIRVGQEVKIPNQDGVDHVVAANETVSTIASLYTVPMDKIIHANRLSDPSRIMRGQHLFIPGAAPVAGRGQAEVPWVWPLSGRVISGFGMRMHPIYHRRMMHQGIDVVAATGSPIRAAKAGRVVRAGWYGGYGRCVDIRHSSGLVTRYAHLSSMNVRVGQQVSQGAMVGRMGASGNVTGPHLHFEIRVNGNAVNPVSYLPRR